ncbi:uncharacterized protein LY89DRAFT_420808 [Mollisia scopiformis]|uniref:MJ1316 RNA cyclic group end recognition domain-containing protein n=1 Tax=Mollisia scopiformis TaxID=149040 RepID=A0A194XMG6_MOLSC|nr:uncharacterized protein LY89DRAFT_420808 [Mollisia scopiformis]KUJ20962.1 hypothetical protein LY89DRAFT_420808 [Mollisia scopiformis]
MGKDNVHLWHYRLTSVDLYSTAMSTTSDDTYEGYYIIGFKAVGTWRRPLVDDITLKWQAQMHTKIMEKQSDGCHRSVTTRVMTEQEMDDIVLRKCPRTWPYNAVEPPDNSGQEADTSVSHSARKAQAVLQNKNHDESASLRPAEDVINRLKYDRANFKVDEWAIGYVDRHMQAMQEKPVRDWATDVTDEAFIPQHRIEYFKVYPKDSPPVIMWEKASKKDLIFTGREGKVNKEVETEADDEMLTKRERKQKAKEENESKQQEWSQEAENGKKEPEAKENVDEERKQKRKGSQKGKKHGKALPQIVTNASVGQPTKQDEQNLTSPKRGKKKRDKENNGT